MSRCFPFPPPGYVVNGIRDEAMIESIKGGEEKCDKEVRRKDRKRDKKEKKDKKGDKEKKDKEKKDKKDKKRKEREGESEKHSHKRRRKEEVVAKDVQNIQKVDVFGKLKESEINCLEKSSLTVEPELVQSTSQNSCDSTLNSNEKDKKQPFNVRHNSNELHKEEMELQMQPLDGSRHNNNDSESIIRIRLPIRRPKDPEVMMMMTNKDQPCPSRDIKLDSLVTKEQPQQRPCSTSAPEQAKRKKHTSSRKHKEKKVPSSTQETYQPSSLCRLCPPSLAEHFLNVVENWVPNTIESRVELTNSEDEDESWWLVKKKPSSHKIDTSKQLNRNNEIKEVVISSSIAWPRASLLPEADVYALPYTVPF